jgi:hypothetical protein
MKAIGAMVSALDQRLTWFTFRAGGALVSTMRPRTYRSPLWRRAGRRHGAEDPL